MYDKLTKKDLEMMEAELEDRRLRIRPAIMEEVKRTREYGDLSENYEYKAAKQAQRRNDSRMRYLQNMIKTAQIVEETAGDGVKLYDKVTLYVPEDEEEMVIQVVSVVRVAPDSGFLSMESPLGKAVLGKKVGDVLEVRVNDSYSYEVEIRKIEPGEDESRQLDIPVDDIQYEISERLSLYSAIDRLEEQDKKRISLRYFNNKTQVQTARALNMTQVQVSRREKKILSFIRGIL